MAGGFHSLGLMPELVRAVDELGWLLPTDVQDESIPLILGGGDVMAAAETGSGKTAAFCLPMIQCVHERLRENSAEMEVSVPSFHSGDVKLSIADKDALLTVDPSGFGCSSTAEKLWLGCRGTHGMKGGKYFYECRVTGDGIIRLGWSTMAAHHEIGKDAYGFGYGGTGKKSYNGGFDDYGGKYGKGDVIGCYCDWTTRTISYSKNGTPLGKAFEIPESLVGTVLFPAVVIKGGSGVFSFGAGSESSSSSSSSSSMQSAYPDYNPLALGSSADIVGAASKEAYTTVGKRTPLAVILEPARDLAEQVYQSIIDMSRYVTGPELNTVLLVGGDDRKDHKKAISKGGGVDIVVGTLGKVADMVKRKELDFSQVKFFILDEADKLIEAENLPTVMTLYHACPAGGSGENRLQVCFFSATLHSLAITDLASKICFNATWVDLKGVDSVPDTVHHVVYKVDLTRDANMLIIAKTKAETDEVHLSYKGALTPDNPDNASQMLKEIKLQALIGIVDKYNMSQCLIFCRTNLDCDKLETFLCSYGGGKKFSGLMESGKEHAYSCCVLAGMRSMQERRANLLAFKEGYVRFLICTDVAARGIDIQGLPYMINLTLPDEPENYIHRIGRVGRADHMGLAISIVAGTNLKEKVWYHSCASKGKGCTNRHLKDEGGCTIWYDEPSCLKGVEARLHQEIPELSSSFELPVELASSGVVYGEQSKQTGGVANLHLEMIGPAVRELAKMEYESQNIFLSMQQRFSS